MDELLATVGGSWRQLLIYPGGLALLLVTVATHRLWALDTSSMSFASRPAQLLQLLGVWLLCALLPWPKTYWDYSLDLFTAVVLAEAPYWLRLRELQQQPDTKVRSVASREIIRALRVYPLLALGLTLLAQSSRSLVIATVQQSKGWEHWAGIVVWSVALPPLLALGPWRDVTDTATNVRRVGHVALLVVVALPDGDAQGYLAGVIAVLVGFGSVLTLHRLWRSSPARWERWQPGVAVVAVALLVWAAVQQLALRLQ